MSYRELPPVGDPLLLDQSMPLDPMFKPRPSDVKWVTAEIAERYEREYYLVITAREMIFYLIFMFCVTMVLIAKIDTDAYYMTDAIRGQLIESKFTLDNQLVTFSDIRNHKNLHEYLTEYLALQLYWTSFDTVTRVQIIENKDKGVLYSNKLIGQPTFRQLLTLNNTCEIHPRFLRHFNMTCRDKYRHKNRFKDYSIPGCTAPDTACNYASSKDTLAVSYYGSFAHYGSDGYQVKMGFDREKFISTANALKEGGWYLQSTRALFLDFMLFNPNLNLFCAVKLVFELPPVGGVFPSSSFHTFRILPAKGDSFKIFADGCAIVYICFIVYYIAEEIREIIFLKCTYLLLFWSYVDVLIVTLATAHIWLEIVVMMKGNNLVKPMAKDSADVKNFSLQTIAHYDLIASNIQGIVVFLVYLKLFKYLSLNIVTGQLNNTLKRSGKYLGYFSVVFFLMMIAFAEFGYLVFGTEIEEYSRLASAMFTLFRTLLADFDYDQLEKTHGVIAPIFFVLFIFMVFFILVNMFLAILCGNYNYVKTEMAVGPEIMQMTEFWKRGFFHLCKSMHCNAIANALRKRNEYNVAAEQIRRILNRCGFTNLEVDVFMARYYIEPADLIQIRDISKLLEFLRIPASENITPKKRDPPELIIKPTGPPIVGIEDFEAQQRKLDEIEIYMVKVGQKVDTILQKMNALQELRK